MRQLIGQMLRRVLPTQPAPQVIDISEDYTQWLCFANAGMLERGNLYCFDYAIRHLPSQAPIVEIGSFCGLSTNLLSYYKEKNHATNKLITADKWEFEGAQIGSCIGQSSIPFADYRAFVRETYLRNIRMFSRSDLPYTVEMLSDEFFEMWRRGDEVQDVLGRPIKLGGPIGFCFIDGNHTYEFARRDFENCDEFLERQGFILFDDSADGSGWGVCDLMKEIEAAGKYELVIKNPNYLFRKN